jgi:hypothetical protein
MRTTAWQDLSEENARLEERVGQLERRLEMIAAIAGASGPIPAGDTGQAARVPDDARREIDRAVAVTDYAVRRFRDLVRALGGEAPVE